MRGLVYTSLWMAAGFVAISFVGDYLETWRTQRRDTQADSVGTVAPAGPTIRFAEPAPNYRPAPKPTSLPLAKRE